MESRALKGKHGSKRTDAPTVRRFRSHSETGTVSPAGHRKTPAGGTYFVSAHSPTRPVL